MSDIKMTRVDIDIDRVMEFGDTLIEAIMETIEEWEEHARNAEPGPIVLVAEAHALTMVAAKLLGALRNMQLREPTIQMVLLTIGDRMRELEIEKHIETCKPCAEKHGHEASEETKTEEGIPVTQVMRDPDIKRDADKLMPITDPEKDPTGWTGFRQWTKDGKEVKN